MSEIIETNTKARLSEILSDEGKIVGGAFFGMLPRGSTVVFKMEDRQPTEYARRGLANLVRNGVVRYYEKDGAKAYILSRDCTSLLKFSNDFDKSLLTE